MMTAMISEPTAATLPEEAIAWRAVEERDERYDGQFVYAVSSTGIYCRPTCPSRRPSRANASFFAKAADAEAAGFRACRRCNPNEAHAGPGAEAVARARAYLDEHAGERVSLAQLGAHVGLSAHHLQRAFKRAVGLSPKAFQDGARARLLKQRLRAGDTVSRATYEAGYGSSSRVYERADAILGMTPAAYRRGGEGVHILYTISNAPVGRVLIATTDRGVCGVELGATDADVIATLRTDFPKATFERNDDEHATWVRAVIERIRDPRAERANRIPLDVQGTAFQMQVWNALQQIPTGERRSYGQIAAAIGRPAAVRAVARACATNRVAVVIPCHRVVREDGALSGYKWGVDRKRQLLDEEAG
jgi:AraC family transcriptional regulator of adaptative response/methylated-DNA-[protein]-cysteine methyltransferase